MIQVGSIFVERNAQGTPIRQYCVTHVSDNGMIAVLADDSVYDHQVVVQTDAGGAHIVIGGKRCYLASSK